MQRTPTILIIAGDHHGNVGDKAIVTATADMLRSRLGEPRILLAGRGSAAYWRPLGVELLAENGASLAALCAAARASDLVICGGGGLFQDDASRVKMPFWAALIASLRPFARRIAGFSIGAGPLRYSLSRRSAAWALRCLDSMSVRDDLARETLAPLTGKPIAVVPDPAFCLSSAESSLAQECLLRHGVPLDGRPLLGVAPRRWFHLQSQWIPHKHAARYQLRKIPGDERLDELVKLLAATLDRVVERHGAHVVFLPTYCEPHEGDDIVAARIAANMRQHAASLLRIDDPRLYQRVAERLAAMLATRMHAAILAMSVGTPIVTIGYNQKFSGVLRLVDPSLHDRSIDEFVRTGAVNDVVNAIDHVLGKRDTYAAVISQLRRRTQDHLDGLLTAVT